MGQSLAIEGGRLFDFERVAAGFCGGGLMVGFGGGLFGFACGEFAWGMLKVACRGCGVRFLSDGGRCLGFEFR
jgi:hypothetical protein